MENQPDLFDTTARDGAIQQVSENAGEEWMSAALSALRDTASRMPDLTTDDVRGKVPPPPNDPRAWGAVMKEAASRGWIEPTLQYRQSADPTCHNRLKRVWRSTLNRRQ